MGRNNTVSVNARFIGAFTNSTYPDAANVAPMAQLYISDSVATGLSAGFYSNVGGVWTVDGGAVEQANAGTISAPDTVRLLWPAR